MYRLNRLNHLQMNESCITSYSVDMFLKKTLLTYERTH